MFPANKSSIMLPFLKNSFEVASDHLLTKGIKAILFRAIVLFPNFGVRQAARASHTAILPHFHSLKSDQLALPGCKPGGGSQPGLLLRGNPCVSPGPTSSLTDRAAAIYSSCEFCVALGLLARGLTPLSWMASKVPSKRASDLESANGWKSGENLYPRAIFWSRKGPQLQRGNLSCLQASGALKSPGRLWARLLCFYAKGPNRMRPGWKLHIVGTQKNRK